MGATLATGRAQTKRVTTRLSAGMSGRTRPTSPGAAEFMKTPKSTGRSTSCTVDLARPSALTGTSCPASTLQSSGVITLAASVDTALMSTLSATSPLAT